MPKAYSPDLRELAVGFVAHVRRDAAAHFKVSVCDLWRRAAKGAANLVCVNGWVRAHAMWDRTRQKS